MGAGLSSSAYKANKKHPPPLQVERRPDWGLVETLHIDEWKAPVAERWGFDFPVHWKNRHLKVHKWPWSKFSVTGRGTSGKEEHLCSFTCKVSETGREERLSPWMKDLSVVGFHPRVLVVQVVLAKAVKLMVVDWQNDQLLGTYSFAYGKEPCLQECLISPDGTTLVCRQDFLLRRRLHHVMSLDSNIRIIRIQDGLCRRLFVIQDFLTMNLAGSGLSFDPRYPSGRLAVFSSTQQAALEDSDLSPPDRLRVYDLCTRRVVAAAPSVTDRIVHHAVHSPDGCMVAALGVNASIYLSCHIFLSSIDLYDADSLARLYHLPLHNEQCKMGSLPLYPSFSRNGSLLAQFTGEHGRRLEIFQMPSSNHSLQEFCRSTILRSTPRSDVALLPLPKTLINFLLFIKPNDTLASSHSSLSEL